MKTARPISQAWGGVGHSSSAAAAAATGSMIRSSQQQQQQGLVVGGGGASRSNTQVDAYAQRLFQEQSSEAGSEPDSSLGPYVTSVLRSTDPQTPLEQLTEYDSLIELIQEHCWVDSTMAASILEQITTAVRTQQVPSLHNNNQQQQQPSLTQAYVGASPRAAERIPGDLWGAIGEDQHDHSASLTPNNNNNNNGAYYSHQQPLPSESAFPPLGATAAAAAAGTEYQSYPAAYTEDYQASPAPAAADSYYDEYQMEQAFESSVEILLSMNPDIAEDAARQALQLVQGDVNWGQYLVDLALTAPPVCRHLLNEGCYRRDCQFSHDIDGHTCTFWLRGRCDRKGSTTACSFRHGFDEKALEAVLPPVDVDAATAATKNNGESTEQQQQSPILTAEDPPLPSAGLTTHGSSAAATSATDNIWGRTSSTSFAQVASQGGPPASEFPSLGATSGQKASFKQQQQQATTTTKRVDIPQDLWHAHENRDSSVFYIADPLERYQAVAATVRRKNVIDLHFQSTKTFATVLETILPQQLRSHSEGVWIVTGTGHHVGTRTHQKGGGALESSVVGWLTDNGYRFFRGRDRNGLGGALLVQR